MLQESSPSYWLYWVKASHRSHLIWTGCCFPDWTQSYPLPEMKHKRGQGLPKVTQPQSCLPTWAENTQLFQAAQEVPSLLNNPGGLAGVEVSFGCILVDINTTPTLPSPEFPSCWENGWTQRTTWTGISSSFLLTICRVISEPPLGWCFRSEKTKHIKLLVWPRLGQLPSRGGLSPDGLMYITAVSPLRWQFSNRGCYSCPEMAEHSAPGGLRLDGQSSGLPHNPGSWWGPQWPHSAAGVGEGQSSPKNGEVGFLFWVLKYCCFFFFSRSFTSDSLQPHGLQHARLPCPSTSPRVCSNPSARSRQCYPTISSSATPSPIVFSLPQHQSLFQWVGSSHEVAKVSELQLQHQSFQRIFRVDFL